MHNNPMIAPKSMVWISIEDRLPPDDEEVLTWQQSCNDNGIYLLGSYAGGGMWLDDHHDSAGRVTHWMPLPKGAIQWEKKHEHQ